MSANAEQRTEIMFYEALELLRSERDGFLNEACGADVSLRAEVDELLRAHDGAAGFLPEDAPASPELETPFTRMKPEAVGERIGNYKRLEQIGEGGFGTVWVAEQEKPVRRRVALKIIKLGMDTKEVIARFEQERQALAMMDHPNIACVGNNVFVAGGGGGSWVVRKNSNGGTTWPVVDSFRFSSSDRSHAYGLAADSSGNIYVAGLGGRILNNTSRPYWIVRKGTGAGTSWTTVDQFQSSNGSARPIRSCRLLHPAANLNQTRLSRIFPRSHPPD